MKNVMVVLPFLFFLFGCPPKNQITPSQVSTLAVKEAVNTQKLSLNIINETAKKIHENAQEIKEIVEEIYVPEFIEEKVEGSEETKKIIVSSPLLSISEIATEIQTQAGIFDRETQSIENQHRIILDMGISLDNEIDKNKKLESQLEEIRKEALNNIYKYLSWLFGLGMMTIIGGGITAFFMSKKLGIVTISIGSLMLGFAAAGTYYMKWIAVFGISSIALAIIATMAFLIYGASKKRESEEILKENNKTLYESTKDIVTLVEAIKQDMTPEKRIAFFGEGKKPGYADIIETRETRSVVDEIRGKNREINSSYLA
jgi:hypothetical protein